MLIIFFFILGLVVGSFLNVVVARLDTKKSIWFGRSQCPHCSSTIVWHDNIPLVSYFALAGKCRNCRKKISATYILVELFTGMIFALMFSLFGLTPVLFFNLIITSFLIVIFAYDLLHYLILDKITIPAMIFAFLGNWYLTGSFSELIIAAILGGGFFALQFFISKGSWVGGGDIRLGALMGFILGIKFLLVALFIAYVVGAIVGGVTVLLKNKKMSSQIPFGPFLVFGTLAAMTYGQAILSWYLNLL